MSEPPPGTDERPRGTGPREAFRVASQRSFGPYFVGNAVSASGGWFYNLAASLLIYRLTGSAFLLGVLNFAQFLPVLLLAPWAGNAAARYDRRRLLLVTQSAAAVCRCARALVTSPASRRTSTARRLEPPVPRWHHAPAHRAGRM